MTDKDKKIDILGRILNVYNEINLDKMAKFIGFKNSINLEQWILDLPKKYHSCLTIKGKNVIINTNVSEIINDYYMNFD